jgi:hypothetical protein
MVNEGVARPLLAMGATGVRATPVQRDACRDQPDPDGIPLEGAAAIRLLVPPDLALHRRSHPGTLPMTGQRASR